MCDTPRDDLVSGPQLRKFLADHRPDRRNGRGLQPVQRRFHGVRCRISPLCRACDLPEGGRHVSGVQLQPTVIRDRAAVGVSLTRPRTIGPSFGRVGSLPSRRAGEFLPDGVLVRRSLLEGRISTDQKYSGPACHHFPRCVSLSVCSAVMDEKELAGKTASGFNEVMSCVLNLAVPGRRRAFQCHRRPAELRRNLHVQRQASNVSLELC